MKYEEVEFEVIVFRSEDVIVTSCTGGGILDDCPEDTTGGGSGDTLGMGC